MKIGILSFVCNNFYTIHNTMKFLKKTDYRHLHFMSRDVTRDESTTYQLVIVMYRGALGLYLKYVDGHNSY